MDEFTPVTELEFEKDLVGLPISLIKENIKSQLLDETDRLDYLTINLHQIDTMKEIYGNNQDFLKEIEDLELNLCGFVISSIEETYDINVHIDYNSLSQARRLTTILYNYLIVNHYDNLRSYILEYINRNKKEISEDFKKLRKDVTTTKVKKVKKNKTDRIISSNIPSIVNHVLDVAKESLSPEEFLEYSMYSTYDSVGLRDSYLDNLISGTFMSRYTCRHTFSSIVNQLKNDIYYTMLENN